MTDVELNTDSATADDEAVGEQPVDEKAALSLRVLVALVGAALCAIGVVYGSPWPIGLGIASLVATSVVPDRHVPLPQWAEASVRSNTSGSLAWLGAGVLLVAISVIGLFRRVDAGWPLVSWLIGLALVTGAAIRHDVAAQGWTMRQRPRTRPFDLWMLGAMTLTGFVLRVRQLETLPPMHGDEGEMGSLALRVGSDEYLAPFTTSFYDHPTLFYWFQKLSMVIFGQSVSGVRMGSAIFGALCIPAVYIVGRLGWTRRVGLVAAAILAFSHTHIHFSRMALNNIHSAFMAIAMVGCLLWSSRALRNRDRTITPLLSTGMTCGIAQYFYFGSRLLPVVLAVGLLVFAWRYRTQFSRLLLVPLGFFLTWLPLVPWYLHARGSFSSRQTGVNIFSEINAQRVDADGTWGILIYQIKRNLRFFIDLGDVSSFYFAEAPGFNAIAAILFWVGLGLALAKARSSFPNFIVLCWFLFGLFLGGVLTIGPPSATRLVIILPAAALFGGIAVEYFFGLVATTSRSADRVRSGLLVVLALLLAIGGTRTYFSEFAANPPFQIPDAVGRAFATQADSADTFLLGEPSLFANHGTLRFLGDGVPPRNLSVASDLGGQDNLRPQLYVIALPQQEPQIQLLRDQIPGGEFQQVDDKNGQLLYFSYLVDH